MSLCASCGLETADGSELCRHHAAPLATWAEDNRLMCDFLHRRRIPARSTVETRGDASWAPAEAA